MIRPVRRVAIEALVTAGRSGVIYSALLGGFYDLLVALCAHLSTLGIEDAGVGAAVRIVAVGAVVVGGIVHEFCVGNVRCQFIVTAFAELSSVDDEELLVHRSVRVVAGAAGALHRWAMTKVGVDDTAIVAAEAQGTEILVIYTLEHPLHLSPVGIVTVGACLFGGFMHASRAGDRFGDALMTLQAGSIGVRGFELVELAMGNMALLAFTRFGEIRPV